MNPGEIPHGITGEINNEKELVRNTWGSACKNLRMNIGRNSRIPRTLTRVFSVKNPPREPLREIPKPRIPEGVLDGLLVGFIS